MSQASIPVILAYPDPPTREYMESLLQACQFNVTIQSVSTLDDLYAALEQHGEHRFIVLSELFWGEQEASDIILSLTMNYPHGAFAIVSAGPVLDFIPSDYPTPFIQGFEDTEKIVNLFSSLTEDLRGRHFGPYLIREFVGQSQMGQIYSAVQPAIKRDVYLTIPHLNADEAFLAQFKSLAASQARNAFPSIYSIYEETEIGGRRVISQEPISGPSLFQFYLNGSTFDDRLLAKIIHTTAGALKHLHDQQIPHPRIKATAITLSENGIIKIHNTAMQEGGDLPDPTEEIALLAQIVTSFIDPNAIPDPRLKDLLDKMSLGEIDLATSAQIANQIDVDHAPIKLVPEREEAKKAALAVQKARKSFWIWAIIGGGSLTAFLIVMTIYVINTYFLVRPGTNFLKQCKIPAGEVINPTTHNPVKINTFYMDEYEVTIGQYEKFLKATARMDPRQFLPPGYKEPRDNFIPNDWKEIITAVKRKRTYKGIGQSLTRDCPIFNVDYADAYAYAKWAGKRLPTELEWIRAASGDKNFKLPWGNTPDLTRANTGADRGKTAYTDSPGSLDGSKGLAEVDKHSKDLSPFHIRNMAGNISEWTTLSPELGKPEGGDGAQRGGNFAVPTLISNQTRLNYPLYTSRPWLGIRCVSDQPVTGPKL